MNNDVLTTQTATCYHCGEECDEEAVYPDGKSFCCTGCKMVYEILDAHELKNYYRLEDHPGISLKSIQPHSRFDFLDDTSVVERLTDFKSGSIISVRFYIPNIHCTSCIWLLEKLFRLDGGITKSNVNFLKRELSLSFDETRTSLSSVAKLLLSIGYEPELRLDKLDNKASSPPDRRLWMKLGIAGFAFGNIMLFSLPEYLSGSTLSEQGSFHIIFGVLNVVLALPVLLYSSSDYLKSAWAAVRQGGINLDVPISIGIIALFSRSIYEIGTGIGAGYMDSFTGLVFFLLIGRIIQKKTYKRLSFDRDYKSYLPLSVTVTDRNGDERSVSLDKLKTGTQILLRNRELVPADAVLLSEKSFIDYSFITGESEPEEICQGETVYAGGRVVGPSVEMKIRREVSSSYLTQLWNNATFESTFQKPRVSSLADRISPHFTLAVIGIAGIAGLLWWPVSVEMGISVFTAVLIIACPCALALSTPFALGTALNVFSGNGLYIKGIEAIERLASVTTIVFDKTGTLTKADRAEVTFQGESLTEFEAGLINAVCRQSAHPLSRKIANSLESAGTVSVESFDEVINRGIHATAGGRHLTIGSESFVRGSHSVGTLSYTESGEAVSRVHVSIDHKWKGWFEVSQSYRPGISELLESVKKRFSTYLISGDNDSQLNRLTPYFKETSLLFNQTPQQKLDFIKELQEEQQRVIMIGDGLNDAGALQQSDFGIALTDDTSFFTPASDAILDGSSLNRLETLIDFSKKSITIIKLSFGLSLVYNVAGLGFAVAGQLTPLVAAILMPLSSISIMVFTTGSALLTARKMDLMPWK